MDENAARRIADGRNPDGLDGAEDYPAQGERVAAQMFLERCAAGLDPRPYGAFIICLNDGVQGRPRAIGGIGFHGPPDPAGSVEIGYGIALSERRHGYATAALQLLISRAERLGVRQLTAETDLDNLASQAVLTKCGFVRSADAERVVHFALNLA